MWLLIVAVAVIVVLPLLGMTAMMMMGMSGMITASNMPMMSGSRDGRSIPFSLPGATTMSSGTVADP